MSSVMLHYYYLTGDGLKGARIDIKQITTAKGSITVLN